MRIRGPVVAGNNQLLAELTKHLNPGERVEKYLIGGLPLPYRGILAVTNECLVYYKKTITGFGLERVPFDQISSIQTGKGLFGYRITATGANNYIGIGFLPKGAEDFVALVRAKVDENNQDPSDGQSFSQDITELNRLKEQGLITEEEYTAKKRQILGL